MARCGRWLVPLVLAVGLLGIAALLWLRPGPYLVPVLTGYVSFLLVGYVEAQLRAARRPSASQAGAGEAGLDAMRRLEAILREATEPLPTRVIGATLH